MHQAPCQATWAEMYLQPHNFTFSSLALPGINRKRVGHRDRV